MTSEGLMTSEYDDRDTAIRINAYAKSYLLK